MHRLNQSQIFQAKYVYSKSDPTATISTEICRVCTNRNYLNWIMHKLNQLQVSHAKHGNYSNFTVHLLCMVCASRNYFWQNMPILSQLQLFQRICACAQLELIATISNETCIFWTNCNDFNCNVQSLNQ